MPRNNRGAGGEHFNFASLPRPAILGIINVTPDSFSDGGAFFSTESALSHAAQLIDEGADALDIGGESTRPGATPVDVAEELRRVVPVVKALRERFPDCVISVDTVKGDVAAAVLEEGADMINDVSALRLDPLLAQVCAEAGAGVILMHSRGSVADMASFDHASYGSDPMSDVIAELGASVTRALHAGISRERIALDPGIGFAKRSEHSLAVLGGLARLVALGFPVAVGVSRKRFIADVAGDRGPSSRLAGTIAANTMALAGGACIFRVHDVLAARTSLDIAAAILETVGRGKE
ncbi:MAG: dihydropteroate synthase [Gemmatimonadaceae bacterium]